MENEIFLPYSARRFKVSINGTVKDHHDTPLNTKLINGHHFVKIEWLNGRAYYPVGLLVLVSFGKIGLPQYLYSEIEILYSDSDCGNLSLGNLLYRFKNGPVEVEEYPSFYYVPMYTDYAVNLHGDLINVHNGKQKSWSKTKPDAIKNQTGGYFYNRVVDDSGRSVTLFRHRALCLVFKRYGPDVKRKYVNHLNGRPGDDVLSNLEWVTPKENNEHAFVNGLRGDNRPVVAWNLNTDEKKSFISISRCATYLAGINGDGIDRRGMVMERLKKKDFRIYEDKWIFKYDDDEPWPTLNLNELEIARAGKVNTVVGRNVFTKEICLFRGVPGAGSYTNIVASSIHSHIRNNLKTPLYGWLFRYKDTEDDLLGWPEYTALQLKIFEKHPKCPPNGLVVHDNKTNKSIFHTSVSEAINDMRFSKSVIWGYIRAGKTPDGRFTFELIEVNHKVSLKK